MSITIFDNILLSIICNDHKVLIVILFFNFSEIKHWIILRSRLKQIEACWTAYSTYFFRLIQENSIIWIECPHSSSMVGLLLRQIMHVSLNHSLILLWKDFQNLSLSILYDYSRKHILILSGFLDQQHPSYDLSNNCSKWNVE